MAISIIPQVDIAGDHFQIHYVRNTSGDESRGLYSRKAALQPDPRKFWLLRRAAMPSEINRAVRLRL